MSNAPAGIPTNLAELESFVEKVAADSKVSNACYSYVAKVVPEEGKVTLSKYQHSHDSDRILAEATHNGSGPRFRIFHRAESELPGEDLVSLGEAMKRCGFTLVIEAEELEEAE